MKIFKTILLFILVCHLTSCFPLVGSLVESNPSDKNEIQNSEDVENLDIPDEFYGTDIGNPKKPKIKTLVQISGEVQFEEESLLHSQCNQYESIDVVVVDGSMNTYRTILEDKKFALDVPVEENYIVELWQDDSFCAYMANSKSSFIPKEYYRIIESRTDDIYVGKLTFRERGVMAAKGRGETYQDQIYSEDIDLNGILDFFDFNFDQTFNVENRCYVNYSIPFNDSYLGVSLSRSGSLRFYTSEKVSTIRPENFRLYDAFGRDASEHIVRIEMHDSSLENSGSVIKVVLDDLAVETEYTIELIKDAFVCESGDSYSGTQNVRFIPITNTAHLENIEKVSGIIAQSVNTPTTQELPRQFKTPEGIKEKLK